jgi:hypothetical protein
MAEKSEGTSCKKQRGHSQLKNYECAAGLPDFSWYKIPKPGKIYQMTKNYQMPVKYTK